jgi:Alginate export
MYPAVYRLGRRTQGTRKTPAQGLVLPGALLFALSFAADCQAQTPPPAQPPSDTIQFSGSLRFRSETWGWFDTSSANPDYTFFATLLRLSLSQRKEDWDWQAEFALPLLANLPGKSIAPAPQGQLGLGASYYAANSDTAPANLFLKQGFIRFKSIFGDKPSNLRFGRFEFVDGSESVPRSPTLAALIRGRIAHRLVGNFGFTHVGRSFDGVEYVRGTPRSNVTFVAARATQGVFQVNGWGELDTDILYGSLTRPVGKKALGEWRLFALSYHDGRPVLKTDNRPATARMGDQRNIRITSLGGDYLQTVKAGAATIDALVWAVAQFGHWGVLEHRAGAAAAEGGIQPGWRLKPWIRGGYFFGSGDQNPADGNHGTFFQVLPTPRIYARFPFYNLMNNQDVFGEFILRPSAKWTLRSDAHFLRLSSLSDLWYAGGGAFQATTFGYLGRPSGGARSLANVYDFSADYQLTEHLALTGYYALADGKTVIEKIYPNGSNGQFVYAELNWKF